MHFEDLWVKCEKYHQDTAQDEVGSIIEELMLKINIYKVIDQKSEIPEDERKKIKSRTLGEILLTLTSLSNKDDIDVFEALSIALQYHSIEHYSQKYST